MKTDAIDNDVVEGLLSTIDDCPGRTQLFFQLCDADGKSSVMLHSRGKEIEVNRHFVSFVESIPGVEYKIN